MADMAKEFLVTLRGGLNTALDPSDIGDHQLQEAQGVEYRPPAAGIYAAGGRIRINSTGLNYMSGSGTHGMFYASYDTSGCGSRLVLFLGTNLIVFNATSGGTSSVLTNLTDADFGDGVHYKDQWFAYNGVDANVAVVPASSGTVGALTHGLTAVTATGSGSFAYGSGSIASGTYDLWWTELDEFGLMTDVESAYDGSAVTVTATAAAATLTFTRPPKTNDGADYWRLYMSAPGQKFPFGYVHFTSSDFLACSGVVTENKTNTFYPVVVPPGGVAVSRNSPPPVFYAATVFQDSIVGIDANNRQKIVYSAADEPHYFPESYYANFETEWNDTLNALAVCNNSLLVFSGAYGYRLDDLPRETDFDDFSAARGRAKERFSVFHGCVSPRGAATFAIFGGGELCLFVCRDGIHITDGFKTDYASGDFAWPSTSTTFMQNLTNSVMKNNPKFHRVEWYYIDGDGLRQRLDFYYHPTLLQPGDGAFPKLPIMGPTQVPGLAAALGIRNNDWMMFNAHYTASGLYYENTGTVDNASLVDSNGTINHRYRTKNFYFAGADGEFTVPDIYVYQDESTASGSATLTLYAGQDDAGDPYTASGSVSFSDKRMQSISLSGTYVDTAARGQNVSVRVVKDDGGDWQAQNYMVFVVNKAGGGASPKSNV